MEASKTLRAPAKLNLCLEVLQKRPDGLHGLRSVMVPVDLCDEISIAPATGFQFSCSRQDLREDNLVERTLRALGVSGVAVHLEKRIPTGAGMGGGSSDAAQILLAAAAGAFGTMPSDLLGLARSLGSDVPFFLVQTAALVEGTGERVTALGAAPPWHAVIVKPPVSVSTAWAYEQLDQAPRESRPRNASVSLRLCEELQRRNFDAVVGLIHNDFHDLIAAGNQQVNEAARALIDAGARHATLTGSGSCVFSLAPGREERDALAARLQLPAGFETFACAFYQGPAWRSAA